MNDLGKLPPQAIDLEQVVLGSMLLEREAVPLIIDILKPESFYKEGHAKIYEAIVDLFNNSEPVDLLTVTEQLRKNGSLEIAGGAYHVAELTTRVNSAANIEHHARIIQEKYLKRTLTVLTSEANDLSYDDTKDVFDLIGETETKIGNLMDANIRGDFIRLHTAVNETISKMYQSKDMDITGVPSGIIDMDNVTGGWQPSDLIIIAARPGMGKTAFVVSCMLNAAKLGYPTAMFSLEMSTYQLSQRVLSAESEIPLSLVKKPKELNNYDWDRFKDAEQKIKKFPLFIDDTAGLSIIELRAKARRLINKHNIKLLIVDYLQLMSGDETRNREQEISTISRALKQIAKEHDIPVIALSQLSRAVETRGGDKKPILSDLRESGSIEQDADMVMFLYRPEYYGIEYDDGESNEGKGHGIISKHRQGALDEIRMSFIGNFTKWTNDD